MPFQGWHSQTAAYVLATAPANSVGGMLSQEKLWALLGDRRADRLNCLQGHSHGDVCI